MRARLLAWAIPAATIAVILAVVTLADRVPGGDAPHLIGVELRLAQLVRDGDVLRAWRLFATLVAPQPPAGYLPGILASVIAGSHAVTPALAMAIPLALCWDALRRLNDGRLPWAGWLAFVASPMVWLYVEQHGRDLVAAAVVLQVISHARIWADEPPNRRAALWTGAWTGAALLVKYTLPVFLFLPLLATLPRALKRPKTILFAGLGALVVAGPWYLAYGRRVALYLQRSTTMDMGAETLNARADRLSPEALLYYPLALKDALGWPGIAAVGVGAVLGRRAGPLLGALGGVAVLSTLSVAVDRYALPAFACLAALALPMGHRRFGAALAALVFVPQLVGTVGRFLPGAPTGDHPRFDHPPATAADPAWPQSPTYLPVRFDVARWRVDEAVEALRAVHGRDDGTVGLLLPRAADSPEFGIFLLRSARLGYRWDFANVNLAARRGGMSEELFMGPLLDGDWPPRAFTALYALHGTDPAVDAWLSGKNVEIVERFPLGGAIEGRVYRVAP